MSLGDSLMPDRELGRQQEATRPETGSIPVPTPTERLYARTNATLDAEFAGIFGAGGSEARGALERAAAVEGPTAYDRFRADPDAFGTVTGNRERADRVGGASEALAYSKAVYAAEQEGQTPSVPGYGAPVQGNGQAPTVNASVERSGTPTREDGHEPQHAEPSIEPEQVRYEMPDLGPWVSTDPSNRLGSPYVTTDSARPVDASGASGATGRYFDSSGRLVGTDGSTDDRRYLINDAGAVFLRQNSGVASRADIRAAGGAVYEIRGTYASYESIDTTFARRRGVDRGESHAALSITATGADFVTDFGTVTAERGDGYNVRRTYTPSDFVRIGNRAEAGDGAEVVFVAHDHPPDLTKSSNRMEMNTLMNNPTGYVYAQNSQPPNDYSAVYGINRMASNVAVRGSEAVYGVLFSRETDGLVFYDAAGREQQVSTTLRAIRSILNQ